MARSSGPMMMGVLLTIMFGISFRLLLVASSLLLFLVPARPQAQDRSPAPAPAVTPTQAQRALDILQDDSKRSQLIETLQTIAKASSPNAAPPAPAPDPRAVDNLGAQLLAQVSDWFGGVSGQFEAAALAVSDLPAISRWLEDLSGDAAIRRLLIETGWKLALVLALALAAEWIIQRVLRRSLAAIQRHMPPGARRPLAPQEPIAQQPVPLGAAANGGAADGGAAERVGARQLHRWRTTLARAWQLALRLPFVLARLVLQLAPVVCFAVVGNLLLATQIGGEATARVVILAIVNAYVLCRGILCVEAAIVSPVSRQPSLFTISEESAAYLEVWSKRIIIVMVFGIALDNIALLLGLSRPAYAGIVRFVLLLVHLFLVAIILQCRRGVADLIRAPQSEHGALAAMRNRLADVWHIVAIVLELALWAVWAFRVQNGYALLLRYVLTAVAVVAIARLASNAALAALARVLRINPEALRQFPGLAARANHYFSALRAVLTTVIAVVTIIALLEIWGVEATAWFASGQLGGRLVSALATIAIACVVALVVWEASNAGLDRQLAQLSHAGRYARAARLRTFLPMLRSALLSVIVAVVALTALSELGVNIAPLLAGAGIVGIAIGFGSQKLVQDLITGLFLLLENAMQVGDTVTVSGLSGVVENLSIRTIRLRAGDGSIHIIPFSSVTSVTNTNRGIGNAAISVNVAYKEDTDQVGALLKEIAAEMRSEPEFKPMIRGDLDLWGVDRVDASMATVVGQIECTDTGRWPVQREFYRRMKKRFQKLGIEIARPAQTTVVLQTPMAYGIDPRGSADEAEQRLAANAARR